MASLPSLPRSLSEWIYKLDATRLPALRQECRKARQVLADTDRSLREITQVIQSTPVLALQVVREANHISYAQQDKAESLEAALTRIGVERAIELLDQIPNAELNETNRPLFQLLLISQHAGQQASGLFSARLARLWQEVHWTSLLFLSPVWTLVGAYPEVFAAWEERVLGKGEASSKVEMQLLNMPLLTLCQALVQHWRMPEWILKGYQLLAEDHELLVKILRIALDSEHPLQQQQALDDDPELRRWLTNPEHAPLLSNALAITSHQGWGTPHSRRWQCFTALYLQTPLEELQRQVHQNAVNSAQRHAGPELWHPAQSLVCPWDERYTGYKKPSEAPPEIEDPIQKWRSCCLELIKTPSPFTNMLHLTAMARDALQACGIHRTLMLQLDPKRNLLLTRQAVCLGSEARFLQIDPSHSQLLKHLLEAPRQVHITPQGAKLLKLLPGAVKSTFHDSQNLLMCSVAGNGKVVLVVISDQDNAPISERSIQGFTKTMHCLGSALNNFANRER